MLALVAVHALTAVIAPGLVRLWGRNALYLVALAPGATLIWALTHTTGVRDGVPVVETAPWVPQLGLELALRMGTLSWLMVVLVGGVGALVLAYSARYFRTETPASDASPPSSSPSPVRCSAWWSPTTCCCSTCSGN